MNQIYLKSFVKRTLKRIFTVFFIYTGAYRVFRLYFRGIGTILMFHRVVTSETLSAPRIFKDNGLVSIELLESCIQHFLNNNYEIISLDQLYDRLSRQKAEKPFVCFTFDDGYADSYEIVYPIFKKYNLPFAIYVSNSFPNRTAILWWQMLDDLILPRKQISFEYQNKEYSFNIRNHGERLLAYSTLRKLILSTPQNQLINCIEAIFNKYGVFSENYLHLTITWEQIVEMSKDPLVTIGSHTMNHLNLKQLSVKQIEEEINNSIIQIEEKTGQGVQHFSYPYGSIMEAGRREFNAAKAYKFKTMVTTREGNIFFKHGNNLDCLPRIEVLNNLTSFKMNLSGLETLKTSGFRRFVTE